MDDKSKVAIIASEEDLEMLMCALHSLKLSDVGLNRKRLRFLADLKLLREQSFE